jgi:cephalosporin hydroxylase
MPAADSLRALAARANASARFRLGRLLHGRPPARQEQAESAYARARLDWDELVRTDLDWDELARTAETELERVYYGHRGRAIFKWRQYLPLYDQAFSRYVGKPVTLVEIGVAEGGSLQLWRNYFGEQARIIGVDINPGAQALAGPGAEVMIGSQADPHFLNRVADHAGEIDVIIDDGSHVCSHQIVTMETLFPRLKTGGVYVCEDLHTSYWEDFGGGPGRADSYIEYVKRLIDKLHHRYQGMPLAPDEIARSIGFMTIGDSIAFFHKVEPAETFMVRVGG